MFLIRLFVLASAAKLSLNSAVKNFSRATQCSGNEFQCSDGSCISISLVCDGRPSCRDNSDEQYCDGAPQPISFESIRRKRHQSDQDSTELNSWYGPSLRPNTTQQKTFKYYPQSDQNEHRVNSQWGPHGASSSLRSGVRGAQKRYHDHSDNEDSTHFWMDGKRLKRQSRCGPGQWRCRDGQCIESDGKCDGMKNCADGSDETHALCRNIDCPTHLFRCTYGACVDGYSKCDNVTNCVDNSDELHPDCTKDRLVVAPGRFGCLDGTTISTTARCDGRVDCPDGSDESVRACGAAACHSAHLFRCAYGACVDAGADCDNKVDCADGSDEADDLCNRSGTPTGTSRPTAPSIPTQPAAGAGECVLPPYPLRGRYVVSGNPSARPGARLRSAHLAVSCDGGYMLSDNVTLLCLEGSGWSAPMPKCVEYCKLNPHRSVTYNCEVPNTQGGTQICPTRVPTGTTVIPTCNTPNYYSRSPVPYMKCLDGQFDYIHICEPECGKVTPDGESYVIGGRVSRRGEFPWHVGVYNKGFTPYMQICGGSIVSSSLVISAAHCFYTDAEKLRPASLFAVAAGKVYRPWNDPNDNDAQKSDVSDIKIPERYRGSITNYQQDIALVFVSQPFQYQTFVRPVCLDFDTRFNNDQLSVGQYGRVAGWGLTKEDGKASQILLTVSLPFVPAGTCIDQSPRGFEEYISGDKFCAGYTNGTSLCKGDSGGGLVFSAKSDRLFTRYYLRGIVSTGPRSLEFASCNSHYYTTFTMTQQFESFIRAYYNRS